MVEPDRTTPVDSPLALRGARCVLIRIGSPISLTVSAIRMANVLTLFPIVAALRLNVSWRASERCSLNSGM
jgi:hypothetical protein